MMEVLQRQSATPHSQADVVASDSSSSNGLTIVASVGMYDVLCGRDKEAFNNIGNRRFRVTVSLTLDRYNQALSRKEKSCVIKSVAALVKGNGGRFLQKQKGIQGWVQLNEKQTHEKVGHALRDMAMANSKLEAGGSDKMDEIEEDVPVVKEGNKRPPVPAKKQPKAKKQKTRARETKNERNAFDDPQELNNEAARIISSSSVPSVLSPVEHEKPTIPQESDTFADLIFDDDNSIMSWLMEESELVLAAESVDNAVAL